MLTYVLVVRQSDLLAIERKLLKQTLSQPQLFRQPILYVVDPIQRKSLHFLILKSSKKKTTKIN